MEKRVFQKNGEQISLLGFGCMRLPTLSDDPKDIDGALAEAMIDYAYENGVNYFDTAYAYHQGRSEPLIGKALSKYPRGSFNLATKMPVWLLEKEGDAETIFNKQLELCGVDYFDFYLAHSLNAERMELIERVKLHDYLSLEKQRGRIRHLGFSFHDAPELLNDLTARYEWDFAQIQLNYFDWEAQNAKLAYDILTKNSLPVVVMEPVRGGTLARLPEAAGFVLAEHDADASHASWAVRFAASQPNVLTVLSGMSTMEQVRDNVKTMSGFKPLTEEESKALRRALVEYKKTGAVPCTGCRYCMDCPSGVDIPGNFAVYSQYKITGNKIMMEVQYVTLGAARQASGCVECGQCVPLCPQFINIPEELKKVAAAAAEAMVD